MHLTKIKKFRRLPAPLKLAFSEAAFLLAVAHVLTKLVPYRWWSGLLGPICDAHQNNERSIFVNSEAAQAVGWAVNAAARNVPWNAVCLPRAMVGKWMLARRDVDSTLCLGICRSLGSAKSHADLHAWLEVGEHTITGGEIADKFKSIVQFGPSRRTSDIQ
ncbi:MAG: lasso peptide biosynthesis B2 protein [Hyphomicrobium sp.]